MDDLFKRAAENYPLLEGADSWDQISERIAEENSKAPFETSNNRNNKFILFASLVSLLIIGGLLLLKQDAIVPLAEKSKLFKPDNNDYIHALRHPEPLSGGKKEALKNIAVTEKKNHLQGAPGSSGRATIKLISGVLTDSLNTSYTIESADKKILQSKTTAYLTENISEDLASKENQKKESVENTFKNGNDSIEKQRNNSTLTPLKDNSGENKLFILSSEKKERGRTPAKNKTFYFGLIAAPELSKVGSMPFGSMGFNAGILAGFNINPRLALEAGVYRNKKYYKSQGKDFSVDKIQSSMAYGMVINSLESKSSLIEIPVKVKYNLSKKNMGLFITGGLSAYVMTEENNLYQVTFNGSGEQVKGLYKKNSYGLPAVAGISIGYQHPLLKKLQIRIEPFFKIPINGIGVGNLPITGAGLQFGIIRPFN